jgi:predicted alpha/beta-hydrolase family hydrolase
VNLDLVVGERVGRVSAILTRPAGARVLYLLAHGAGAGMRHRFMEAVAGRLAERDVASLRYQFPYLEAGARRPDPPAVLEATVRAAVATAAEVAPDLPRIAGGKSMGGRMTSGAQAHAPLPDVRGLVFLGFPLHPPRRPGEERAAHLAAVRVPMLFLQGTRDDLADLGLISGVCARLGAGATLHVVEGADHAFEVLKRSGRTGADVLDELAGAVVEWCRANRIGQW